MNENFVRQLLISSGFALASCMALPSAGLSASLDINNSGFEALTLPDGEFTAQFRGTAASDIIPGWVVTGPDAGTTNPFSSVFTTGIPEGQNTAFIGGTLGGGVISQVLSDVLQVGTYDLKVDIGNTAVLSAFAGYGVQLLAGGNVLVEDQNTLRPSAGTFTTSTLSFNALAGNPLLSQRLEIRLSALTPGLSSQTNFDNVRLGFVPNAVPTPALLPGLVGLGLGVWRKRRAAVSKQEVEV